MRKKRSFFDFSWDLAGSHAMLHVARRSAIVHPSMVQLKVKIYLSSYHAAPGSSTPKAYRHDMNHKVHPLHRCSTLHYAACQVNDESVQNHKNVECLTHPIDSPLREIFVRTGLLFHFIPYYAPLLNYFPININLPW